MRIAVMEDDPLLAELLCATLGPLGHDCHIVVTGSSMLVRLRQESFDLLLLDWNVPGATGLEVLQWAQEHLDPCPPAIMITLRDAETDIVAALDAGADDYITKPFQPAVARARVDAVLRRRYPAPVAASTEELSGLTFDHRDQSVKIGAETVTLTAKEFALAAMLMRNTQRPLSRAHLLEAVWGRNPDLPTRTLDAHISKIRTKLHLTPEKGFRLVPVYSFGYRLELVEA
ncbi:response regulator transcription factor [Sphingoaurantiacus capsulatus]|uniref:Response regulator transcription factor n=1 Tax=Sphingoaurantiacus capsulatus TaxID=1771310 RepID=A0ABV7X7N2_9SPHN